MDNKPRKKQKPIPKLPYDETEYMPEHLKPKKNPPGRPKAVIDYNQVEKLARMFCTLNEICDVLGYAKTTCLKQPGFREAFKRGRETGKCSLRRAQYLKATKQRDSTMQIWLGKNVLGQRDNVQTEINIRPQVFLSPEQGDLFEPSVTAPEQVESEEPALLDYDEPGDPDAIETDPEGDNLE